MEKFKGKYEIILGFVTLVVSLSAFKEELSKINLELGFTTLSLSQYFLYSVIGFSICLYFYIIEHVVRETKIGHWKIFDYLIAIAYGIFIFVLISPLLIILNIFSLKLYGYIIENPAEQKERTFLVILQIIYAISLFASWLEGNKFFKKFQNELKEEAEKNQIIEVENATKLYEDGYYAQSILENFKALESYLHKKIVETNNRPPKSLHETMKTAFKLKIIRKEDSDNISALLRMRINSAHNTGEVITKKDALLAMNFVKGLISR